MIIENITIEKGTKVILTINNVVTCNFSSDGLHYILYFHSWFMWRYNKTTVGNLSTENCSVKGWFGNSIHTNSRLDMFKVMRTFEEKHESIWYCFYYSKAQIITRLYGVCWDTSVRHWYFITAEIRVRVANLFSCLCCPIMLLSLLWWPLRFPHKKDVRFVFTSSCL